MLRILLFGGLGAVFGSMILVATLLAWQLPSQLEEGAKTIGAWTPVEILAFACLVLMGTVGVLCLTIRFLFRRNQKHVETIVEAIRWHSDSIAVTQESATLTKESATLTKNELRALKNELLLRMEVLEKVIEGCRGRFPGGSISGS